MFDRLKRLFGAPALETRDVVDEIDKVFELTMGPRPVANVPYLNEITATTIPAVFIARKIIAETLANLPLNVYQITNDDELVKDRTHNVYRLWNQEPNPYQIPFSVREAIIGNAVLYGNGFAEIQRNVGTGEVENIYPLDPYRVSLTVDGQGRPQYKVDSGPTPVDPQNIFHLVGPTPNASEGYRIVRLAASTFSLAKSIEVFGLAFFGNNCQTGGTWQLPPNWSEERERNFLEALQQDHAGPEKAYRDRLAFAGATYIPSAGVNNSEGQFIEAEKNVLVNVARFFGIPPVLMLDYSRGTFNNAPDNNRRFLEYCAMPWMKRFEQQCRKLFLPSERDTYIVRHDVEHLLRADPTARIAANVQACGGAYLTVNEVRHDEGYDDIGPSGDILLPPPNMGAPVDGNGNPGDSIPDTDSPDEQSTDSAD